MNKQRSTDSIPARSVQDKAYDLLAELYMEQETASILEEMDTADSKAEIDAFFAKQDQKNLAIINSYFRKQKTKHFWKETLPKVEQIAASVIALITITGGIAIASGRAVRVQIVRLMFEMNSQYAEIKLVEDGSFDVPADWQGNSFPSYIPTMFENGNIYGNIDLSYCEYTGIGETRLTFTEYSPDAESNIDIENAKVKPIMIGSNPGLYSEKNNLIIIVWSDGQSYFSINTMNIGEQETMKIANSVRRIN